MPPHQVCKALAVVGTRGRGAALVLIPGSLRLSLRKALLLPRLLLPAHMIRLPAVRCSMLARMLARGPGGPAGPGRAVYAPAGALLV